MKSVLSGANRNFLGLLLSNSILGAAMPMPLILSGVSGLMLAPSPALATLPLSLRSVRLQPVSSFQVWDGRSSQFYR